MNSSVVVSISGDDTLLGIVRGNADVSFPQGSLLLGEEPKEAAVRVLREQTGYAALGGLVLAGCIENNKGLVLIYWANRNNLRGQKNESGGVVGFYSTRAMTSTLNSNHAFNKLIVNSI